MPDSEPTKCAPDAHDIRRSATECGRCGAHLCELCGSDAHATHEGHDLSNPRYWGV
jgi:hypothetical protein